MLCVGWMSGARFVSVVGVVACQRRLLVGLLRSGGGALADALGPSRR